MGQSSPNNMSMIKSRKMIWAGGWENRNKHRALVRKVKHRDHLEDLGVDGRIILK